MATNRKDAKGGKWRRARRRAIRRAGNRCERCGAPPPLQVHHKTPLSEGGHPRDPENLQALCPSCHGTFHQ
ncbi:MAG: HNH endonuclease [Boseongicola sp. SB0662_bin_57]|nr:HNH endonuclease [Boseongicola sp. SB0662_bin_57]